MKKAIILFIHAFIGWGLCAAVMWIGMIFFSLDTALIIHAAAAPVIFSVISIIYFKKFDYTKPITTGVIFVGIVIAIDFFIVALVINKSLEMFTNFIGTWLPFILIFCSTMTTGYALTRKKGI